MNLNDIDLTNVEVSEPQEFMALPAGKYRVIVSEAEYKQTAAGNGHRIALQLTILSGEFKGRKLFEGLNVDNPNEVAEQIGKQRLAEICDAIHIARNALTDVSQIEGNTLIASVTRSASSDPKYGDSNGHQNGVAKFEADTIAKPADSAPAPTPAPESTQVESPW